MGDVPMARWSVATALLLAMGAATQAWAADAIDCHDTNLFRINPEICGRSLSPPCQSG
jgi:hypothetical protein